MALVSPSVPIHIMAVNMERNQMRACPRTTSVRSAVSGGLREIEEEPEETPAEEEDKVYVALGKDYKDGRATLIWVLQNTGKEKKIIITHVHRPAQMIPMMGAKFPASQIKQEQVSAHWEMEREKMHKSLDEYLALCSQAKFRAEKLVIEMDDVGKGLLELIAQHGIEKLVIGAAADKQYSRRMKVPRSKTAITVQQKADPSCKIWFVCKGILIFTRPWNHFFDREAGLNGYEIAQSQITSLSTISSQSEQLRSRSLPEGQTENWLSIPMQDILGPRSRSANFDPHAGGTMGLSPLEEAVRTSSTTLNESEEGLQFSPARHELEDVKVDDEVYEKLQDALAEAEKLRRDAFKESCRRQKAEMEAIEAARKAKAAENLYAKEVKQRKETEETLAREKMELEKLKIQRDQVSVELQKAHEQELALEIQISDSDRILTDLEEKLSAAQRLLSSLRSEHEELQRERDDAVKEAEGMRAMNFSEFSYSELKQATHNFDDSMKIGEGGYGGVYKGFLRHTMVAIKTLKAQSMQGQSEFHQEVDVLSRVRHPHLVTLIGACSEAWALIYEHCPNGSLEDRLLCRGNTPPLSWQVRTRMAAEICSALIFLHSNKPYIIVHGDLKPGNILIDANFETKLGDFGICRLLSQANNTTTPYHHTHPKGTLTYMDPEFIASGELTPRSDVYSFGVILLRLLTGKPALGLAKEVQEAVKEDRLHGILDPSAGDWPIMQAKQLTHLALRCCEMKRKRRPNLAVEAWKVLEPMMEAASCSRPSYLSFGSDPDETSCIPSYFICSISKEIMRDPHIAADGFTYEAEALRGWFDSGHDTSPITNLKFPHREHVPNHALRYAIQEWLRRQK